MKRSRAAVQELDFEVSQCLAWLGKELPDIGALVSFVGTVRDSNRFGRVHTLTLEHYPGMTEKSLEQIIDKAKTRFEILSALVIHRVGILKPQDQIVFVGVGSQHRQSAFQACEFIVDALKTEAVFWKKETTAQGENWVSSQDAPAFPKPPRTQIS